MANAGTYYRERLTVSWWVWLTTLATAAVLAAQLTIGAVALRHPLTYLIACALGAGGLLALGRIQIEVIAPSAGSPGHLRVDDARLPFGAIASVRPVNATRRRDLLGAEADPLAFVIQRPWVPGGVRIDLDDPTDPTPYWYVSSRHPQRLAAAIMAAVAAGAPNPASGLTP